LGFVGFCCYSAIFFTPFGGLFGWIALIYIIDSMLSCQCNPGQKVIVAYSLHSYSTPNSVLLASPCFAYLSLRSLIATLMFTRITPYFVLRTYSLHSYCLLTRAVHSLLGCLIICSFVSLTLVDCSLAHIFVALILFARYLCLVLCTRPTLSYCLCYS
jgi:hypothetical protein